MTSSCSIEDHELVFSHRLEARTQISVGLPADHTESLVLDPTAVAVNEQPHPRHAGGMQPADEGFPELETVRSARRM